MTAAAEPVFFNPLEPGYIENPWPHLAEIRRADPVHHLLTGQWGLFRYEDVFAILRDRSLSVDDRNADLSELQRADLIEEIPLEEQNRSILNIDPPDHTRLRSLVSKAFTPRTIEGLRPRIQAMVDEMLDTMQAEGHSDVVARLAFPLPFDVISEMLGMPDADAEQIKHWSAALVKTLDPVITEAEIAEAMAAGSNMDALIDDVIAWKTANPADDLLTAMIEAEVDGDRMTPKELRDQVSLLFIAGHETTVNLIGTGLYELLRHPDQLAVLRSADTFPPTAVDELLRWVSPVQISRRIATADIELAGKTIPNGAFVLTSLAAANHDPAFWGDTAEILDLHRADAGRHVSFGSGVHYCLGASLAKLEAEIAIGGFVRRFGQVDIVEEPTWNGRINLRGLESLVVDLT
ncbi:MAG: cytochrome P450 [Actinomycetota bacterium]